MDREVSLLRIASKQYSVFHRRQAIANGFSAKAIQRRLDSGVWLALHRSVYIAAGTTVGWEARVFASLLSRDGHAVASFLSARAIWGFADEAPTLHLTVPERRSARSRGVVVHRAASLDGVSYRGFRVTNPMRTLLDLAQILSDEELELDLDEAIRRRIVDVVRFVSYLDQRSAAGVATLRELVALRDPGRPIASELETLFLRAVREARLPLPVKQHPVRTRRGVAYIDFAYPHHKLAIELDGWDAHGTVAAFAADRARQNELEELGWHFRRFVWRHVRNDPADVAFSVARGLGLRPVRWC